MFVLPHGAAELYPSQHPIGDGLATVSCLLLVHDDSIDEGQSCPAWQGSLAPAVQRGAANERRMAVGRLLVSARGELLGLAVEDDAGETHTLHEVETAGFPGYLY